jgi:hypothetical protein
MADGTEETKAVDSLTSAEACVPPARAADWKRELVAVDD